MLALQPAALPPESFALRAWSLPDDLTVINAGMPPALTIGS
jgi:hypothetical protein